MSVTTDESAVAAIAAQLRKEAANLRELAAECRAKEKPAPSDTASAFYSGIEWAAKLLDDRADRADKTGYLI